MAVKAIQTDTEGSFLIELVVTLLVALVVTGAVFRLVAVGEAVLRKEPVRAAQHEVRADR